MAYRRGNGGRLGQVTGPGAFSFNVKAQFPGLRLTDQITGAFRSGAVYRALGEVHTNVAIEMQKAMVDRLNEKVRATRRAQRQGNRLALSINNERNREVFANTFRVGIPSWLDRSPAKLYWRRIEEGDQATFDGYILFTNNIAGGKRYAPYTPGEGDNAPPGYKHMRMPQHKGIYVQGIGPYPAYNYQDAGYEAFQRMNMRDRYDRALRPLGLTLSDLAKK